MESYWVTGHAGAVEWARRRGLQIQWQPHLEDAVLEVTLPEDVRRKELTADNMDRYGATLVEYQPERIGTEPGPARMDTCKPARQMLIRRIRPMLYPSQNHLNLAERTLDRFVQVAVPEAPGQPFGDRRTVLGC